jgi:hypothetical protein
MRLLWDAIVVIAAIISIPFAMAAVSDFVKGDSGKWRPYRYR